MYIRNYHYIVAQKDNSAQEKVYFEIFNMDQGIFSKYNTKGKKNLQFDELYQMRLADSFKKQIFYLLVKDEGVVSIQIILFNY